MLEQHDAFHTSRNSFPEGIRPSSRREQFFQSTKVEVSKSGPFCNSLKSETVYEFSYLDQFFKLGLFPQKSIYSQCYRIQVWELRIDAVCWWRHSTSLSVLSLYNYIWELNVPPDYAIFYPRPVYYWPYIIVNEIIVSDYSKLLKC